MQSPYFRWPFGLVLAVLFLGLPYGYYRLQYNDGKRLRVVTPGKLFRSGQLTAAGLDEAMRRFGIRTVLNLQEEATDPVLDSGDDEKAFVEARGAKYHFICVDYFNLNHPQRRRPYAVDQFLELLDDPNAFPLLIHCRAGLHRTGVLTALYRMEYEGWSRDEAMRELKKHGFGDSHCTARNLYVLQYVLQYQPRGAHIPGQEAAQGP